MNGFLFLLIVMVTPRSKLLMEYLRPFNGKNNHSSGF